jgi:hypothetical protein
MIKANNKTKIDYKEKLSFADVQPFFKDLIDLLPLPVDLSKKAHNSIDFNLILD